MRIYEWPEEKLAALKKYLCQGDIGLLEEASLCYDAGGRHQGKRHP